MKFLVILFCALSFGMAENLKENKIVGGQIAELHSIPHQVAILVKKTSGEVYLCGGSLLNENTVLTAAHCLRSSKEALVIIGVNDLTANETGVVKQFVNSSTSYRIHPQFNFHLAYLDIALIFLPNPVNFSEAIQPVKLPSGFQLEESFTGEIGKVSGFGQYCDNCGSSQFLRFTENRVMSEDECAEKIGFGLIPSETQLCLSTMETKSSNCRGDSGGPVTINRRGTEILIGISSFGSRLCEEGQPTVFTRLTTLVSWILEEIERNNEKSMKQNENI